MAIGHARMHGMRDKTMLQPLSPRNCLAFALEVERAGALFYARMATRFEAHAPLRELLVSLAQDERQHEDLFSRLSAAASPAGDSDPVASSHLKVLALSRFFVGPNAALANLESISSVHQVLRIALDFERNTLESFVAMRDVLGEHVNLDALDRLIEAERMHVKRLEAFVR
jgi:rubrerythrin